MLKEIGSGAYGSRRLARWLIRQFALGELASVKTGLGYRITPTTNYLFEAGYGLTFELTHLGHGAGAKVAVKVDGLEFIIRDKAYAERLLQCARHADGKQRAAMPAVLRRQTEEMLDKERFLGQLDIP